MIVSAWDMSVCVRKNVRKEEEKEETDDKRKRKGKKGGQRESGWGVCGITEFQYIASRWSLDGTNGVQCFVRVPAGPS